MISTDFGRFVYCNKQSCFKTILYFIITYISIKKKLKLSLHISLFNK